jgi:hypothetical protein
MRRVPESRSHTLYSIYDGRESQVISILVTSAWLESFVAIETVPTELIWNVSKFVRRLVSRWILWLLLWSTVKQQATPSRYLPLWSVKVHRIVQCARSRKIRPNKPIYFRALHSRHGPPSHYLWPQQVLVARCLNRLSAARVRLSGASGHPPPRGQCNYYVMGRTDELSGFDSRQGQHFSPPQRIALPGAHPDFFSRCWGLLPRWQGGGRETHH